MFGAVAIAVDYGEALRKRGALQASADAAALAGVAPGAGLQTAVAISTGSPADPAQSGLAIAAAVLTGSLQRKGLTEAVIAQNITPVANGVAVEVTYRQKTYLAGLLGFNSIDVQVRSVAQKQGGTRVLDVAMCIDATGSMQPTIDAVKQNAMALHQNLNTIFTARSVPAFDVVRVRPIFFRDFGGNAAWYSVAGGGKVDKYPNGFENRPAGDARNMGDDVPMRAAPDFFNLVDSSSQFHAFVEPEIESGGGDYTETGLECINEAIDSAWQKPGQDVLTPSGLKRADDVFSLIVVWTDDDVHPPAYSPSLENPNYPPASKMPRTYDDLRAKWRDPAKVPQANKLLATFRRPSAPTNGWQPVLGWDRYMDAGTLTAGTTTLVETLAQAVTTIAGQSSKARLTQ
jgi:hypothetical protein